MADEPTVTPTPTPAPAADPAPTHTPPAGDTPAGDTPAASDGPGAATSEPEKDGKPAAAAPKADDPAPAPERVVPEKYDLVVPDDAKTLLDSGDLAQIEAQCKAAKLTQDEAAAHLSNVLAHVAQQSVRYRAELEADPTYGGTNLEMTQRMARLAVDSVLPDGHPMRAKFLAFMERGGAGNALPVMAYLATAGKRMAEDSAPGSRAGAGGPRSAADVLFGDAAK